MKIQRILNFWSCLPSAFAMILDIPVEVIIQMVGHDGSEIWWPGQAEPYCRRGFHPQELIHVCEQIGVYVTEFQPRPSSCSLNPNETKEIIGLEKAFEAVLIQSQGVLTGVTLNGNRHSIAFDHGIVGDPNGLITKIDDFTIESFWRVIKSENFIFH